MGRNNAEKLGKNQPIFEYYSTSQCKDVKMWQCLTSFSKKLGIKSRNEIAFRRNFCHSCHLNVNVLRFHNMCRFSITVFLNLEDQAAAEHGANGNPLTLFSLE